MKFQKVKNGFFLLLIIYLIMLTGFRCQGTRSVEGQVKANNMKDMEMKLYTQNDQNTQTPQWMCPCLNGGSCYSPGLNHVDTQSPNNIFCHCRSSYIGSLCERRATYIPVESDIYQKIRTTQYKYFYYRPKQENAYSFSFHICFADPYLEPTNLTNQQKTIMKKMIKFFIMIEHPNGSLELNDLQNQPETIILEQDQCKYIQANQISFSKTKSLQIQKLVFAIKLGYKLGEPKTFSQQKNNTLKQNLNTQIIDKNNSNINYTINRIIKKSHSKKFFQIQLNKNKETRLVFIDFNISVYSEQHLLDNVLFLLATVLVFVIVVRLIFLLRTKVLRSRLNESLNPRQGLTNNIKYFEKFMPSEYFRLKHSNNMKSVITDEQKCVICLFAFKNGDNFRRTPCNHIFHKSCIDPWCLKNPTCPVCRKSLTQKNLNR